MASKLLLAFLSADSATGTKNQKEQRCVSTKLEDKVGKLQKSCFFIPFQKSFENHLLYFLVGKLRKDQEQQTTDQSSHWGGKFWREVFFHGVFPAGSAAFAATRDDETWSVRQNRRLARLSCL